MQITIFLTMNFVHEIKYLVYYKCCKNMYLTTNMKKKQCKMKLTIQRSGVVDSISNL